jgi:hypothetical protein
MCLREREREKERERERDMIELWESRVHIRSHTINAINNFRTPHPNMTRNEREAIHELRKNPEITLIPADKGHTTVLMPTADYETKMAAIVKDTSTYRKLPGDPTMKYKTILGTHILHQVKNKGYITDKKFHEIRPNTQIAPCIIAQTKMMSHTEP